jgi:transposase InsO family protein
MALSRRDGSDRSLARSAWNSPQKTRPVGYSVIRAGVRIDARRMGLGDGAGPVDDRLWRVTRRSAGDRLEAYATLQRLYLHQLHALRD